VSEWGSEGRRFESCRPDHPPEIFLRRVFVSADIKHPAAGYPVAFQPHERGRLRATPQCPSDVFLPPSSLEPLPSMVILPPSTLYPVPSTLILEPSTLIPKSSTDILNLSSCFLEKLRLKVSLFVVEQL
jgi:hypothetical protein